MKKIFILLTALAVFGNSAEIYATFQVEASKSSNLAFDTSGIVKTVYVNQASVVKKGDLLAELQNDEIKSSLEVAKASLASSEVAVKFAKKDYERQLKVKDLIDEAQLDKYAFAYENAEAKLKEAKANLAQKKILYEKTFLYAPYSGVIYEKIVDAGDAVSGAMLRTIFKMQNTKVRKLVLEFDQKYWKDVKAGQTFKFTLDGDPQIRSGKISKIYPSSNSANRKIKAEVAYDNLIVGLFGNGYITTNK